MENEKLVEGIAVMCAILSGRCEKCSSYAECKTNEHFKFPEDAYCMKAKNGFLKTWGAEDGK